MSSGSWTIDNTHPLTNCDVGGAQDIGILAVKSWFGVDGFPKNRKAWHYYNCNISAYAKYKCNVRRVSDSAILTACPQGLGFTVTPRFPALPSYDDVWQKIDTLVRTGGNKFNAGIALAESKQTTRLIQDNIKRIGKSLKALKRGNIFGAITALGCEPSRGGKSYVVRSSPLDSKVYSLLSDHYAFRRKKTVVTKPVHQGSGLAELWLSLQYGWKPLLADVFHASNLLFDNTNVARKTSVTARKSNTWSNAVSSDNCRLSFDLSKATTKITVWLEEDFEPQNTLGLTDPSTVIWEKIPFSFVADWFIPIGNYLQARAAKQKLNGTFSFTSFKVTRYVVDPYYLKPGLPWALYSSEGLGPNYGHGVVYERSAVYPINDWWGADPTNVFPKFKTLDSALSVPHILNAIALVRANTRSSSDG